MSVTSSTSRGRTGAVLARLGLFIGVSAIAGVLAATAALPLVGGMGVAARSAVQGFESLPADLVAPPLPQQSVLLAADGTRLATVFYQNRIEVPLADVAPVMARAIVAIEDSRFYEHRGVDVRGTTRALVATSGGSEVQGGSTITQQYVKNVLLTAATTEDQAAAARERTVSRKIKELRYALQLEKRFTKDQILEKYLNISYFGAGAYGVEAASRRYFSKSAKALTLPEAALLAGIVQQPVGYDPLRNPKNAEIRRNVVLARMAELGYITAAQEYAARGVTVKSIVKPTTVRNGCTTSFAPFFCDYVLQVIRTDPTFGKTRAAREAVLRAGGLTIRTTIEKPAQVAAIRAVMNAIPPRDPSGKAAALSMVRPGTGEIIAMAQNRKWGTQGRGVTTYNYNVDRKYGGTIGMQGGSTFKIFTLAAALENDVSAYEQIQAPASRVFKGFTNCSTGAEFPPYRARNSTGSGSFNMYAGTALSVNTYFLELELRTGLCRPVQIATQMGVGRATGEAISGNPSFTLGTDEISPLSLAGAYAGFANHGKFCRPIAITSIVNRNGKQLKVPEAGCTQVVSREVADAVTSLLVGVIDGPLGGRTGRAMSLGRPAAGKTGTTNTSAAVWFAGYTPELAAAVWVGDPRGGFRYNLNGVTINGEYYDQVFGGTIPGPIWKQAMGEVLATAPKRAFDLEPLNGIYPPPKVEPKPKPSASPAPSGSPAPGTSPAPARPGATPKPGTTAKPAASPAR